jgi:hypothetical protein
VIKNLDTLINLGVICFFAVTGLLIAASVLKSGKVAISGVIFSVMALIAVLLYTSEDYGYYLVLICLYGNFAAGTAYGVITVIHMLPKRTNANKASKILSITGTALGLVTLMLMPSLDDFLFGDKAINIIIFTLPFLAFTLLSASWFVYAAKKQSID